MYRFCWEGIGQRVSDSAQATAAASGKSPPAYELQSLRGGLSNQTLQGPDKHLKSSGTYNKNALWLLFTPGSTEKVTEKETARHNKSWYRTDMDNVSRAWSV